jgi:DNA-binding beta-propeller fold protein YncE
MAIAVEAQPVRYSHTIGGLAQSGAGFNGPIDVAVGRNGLLYVLSRSNMAHAPMGFVRVTICTIDQQYIGQFGKFGDQDGGLIWPASVACDRQGNVYVSDEKRHDVQVFDGEGAFLRRFGGPGSGPGQFNRPSSLAIGPDGNVLVSDCLNHRVQKLSPDGEPLAQWGQIGSGPGQFTMPWGVCADHQGNVYVSDWRNDRVQKLSPHGAPLAIFGRSGAGEGEISRPAGVGVDSVGNVYVADHGNDRLVVYGPDGQHLATLLGDATMTKWAEGVIAADPEMSALRRTHADDVALQERVFENPSGVEVDDEDRVFIADYAKHRIQVYQRS